MVLRPRSVPRSVLFLAAAACSGKAGAPSPTSAPTEIAVPLTASTASLAQPRIARDDVVPPWSLTASDGSGLVMTRVDAKAVFEGPLAFTELHLYFHNNEDRRREGTFQITLPPHAAVSRFAMETDGHWMEAEVVEKQLARRAYDDFLHRRQDPALLEKAPGNQFTAKVFPIPAKGDKHIVISYSQELAGERYVLPLRGLPKIERVDVALEIGTPDGQHTAQTLSKRNWQPDSDFVSSAPTGAAAVDAGTLVAAQVTLPGTVAGPAETPAGVTLLVDTSASRALGYERYLQEVDDLISQLRTRYGAKFPLQVVAFDQDSQLVYTGTAEGWGTTQHQQLVDRGAAGASDLGQALAQLAGPISPQPRVLVVTDGVITAGAERADLEAAIHRLADRQVDRLDVVLAGGLRDAELAGALVHAGLPHAGAVLDLDADGPDLAADLEQPVAVDLPVEIAGATWIYPHRIPALRAGTSTMIYARLAAPTQTCDGRDRRPAGSTAEGRCGSIDLSLGGVHQHIGMTAAAAPLVERAVASAEITELEERLATAKPEERAALRTDIAKRSVAARVVSSQTSMLVLESDEDYARYGIDRTTLADILVIGAHGLESTHQQAPAQLAGPTAPPRHHMDDGDDRVPRTKMVRLADEAGKDKKEDTSGDDGNDQNGLVDNKPEEAPKGQGEEDETRTTTGAGDATTVDVHVDVAGRVPRPSDTPVTAGPQPVTEPRPPVVAPPPAAPEPAAPDTADPSANDVDRAPWPPKDKPAALTGELAAIEHALAQHDVDGALAKARDWHAQQPGDVRALIGLGDALEAKGSLATAARVYGSIIDLFPGRADMRRFAGERLARVAARLDRASDLVIDTYRRAVADRPDHLTGHRLLAYALLRAGKPADAFAAILAGVDQPYPAGRFLGGDRVLADDAGMIGAAYVAAEPSARKAVEAELAKRHLELATRPSTRFILYWETDGNDVDFHIQDARGNHAWYGHKPLASGGELYADITTGYGPECFAIPGRPEAGPYRLSIDYYSQGPMGYGMGLLEIQRFDGKGKLTFEDRPYVIMNDHAYVDLGSYQ